MTCYRVGSEKRRKRSGLVCVVDYPRPDTDSDCPSADQHEPFPAGYVAASEHADKLMETHEQVAPCPGCGRWAIWTPKARRS